MKRTILFLVAACALAGTGIAKADVVVGQGGETLFVLKAKQDLGKTDEQRANDVYDRLRTILNSPNFRGSQIKVKKMGNYGVKIVANNQLIVPIGEEEAKANGTTPMKLGQEWAAHLRKVMPKLNARPDLFVKKNKYTKKKPTPKPKHR
ncbi:MAG: hypothetical protein QM758_12060 [Armatimonas sp.]